VVLQNYNINIAISEENYLFDSKISENLIPVTKVIKNYFTLFKMMLTLNRRNYFIAKIFPEYTMKKWQLFLYALRIIVLVIILPYFTLASGDDKKKNKTLTNDNYRYIARNEIKMWFSNNGDGSHDPLTDDKGLYLSLIHI